MNRVQSNDKSRCLIFTRYPTRTCRGFRHFETYSSNFDKMLRSPTRTMLSRSKVTRSETTVCMNSIGPFVRVQNPSTKSQRSSGRRAAIRVTAAKIANCYARDTTNNTVQEQVRLTSSARCKVLKEDRFSLDIEAGFIFDQNGTCVRIIAIHTQICSLVDTVDTWRQKGWRQQADEEYSASVALVFAVHLAYNLLTRLRDPFQLQPSEPNHTARSKERRGTDKAATQHGPTLRLLEFDVTDLHSMRCCC